MSGDRITLRVEDWHREALDSIAGNWGVSRSEIIRQAISDLVDEYAESVPDWVEKEAVHDKVTTEYKPDLRTMRFRKSVHDYLKDLLMDENGNVHPEAPHPDKVRETYIEGLRETLYQEHPDYAEEYDEYLKHKMDWYKMLHPETATVDREEWAVEMIRIQFGLDRENRARSMAKTYAERLDMSEHEILDTARDKLADLNWREEWTQATNSNVVVQPEHD